MRTKQLSEQIDRYCRGDMSPAERQQFDQLLTKDPALRQACDTDRMIASVFQRDRAAIPSDHALAEQRILAALRSAPPPAPSGLPAAGAVLSAKLVSTVVVGLCILAGSAWLWLRGTDGTPVTPPRTTEQSIDRTPQPAPQPAEERVIDRAARELPAGDARHEIHAAPSPGHRAAGSPAAGSSSGSAVFSPDTVHVKLKLDQKKLSSPQ
jgi:hypothetical protein